LKRNETRVRRLLSELARAIQRLKELRALPQGDFLADPHRVASAKYHFIVAIEAAIDISNHLISKNCLGTPEDYGDVFRILGKAGVLPREFADRLVTMTLFRNRLVHIYWEVDDAELHRLLTDGVEDLERFVLLLRQALAPKSSPL